MNKIYKLIWSKVKNCYVVASELAKSHTKSNGARSARLLTARVTCTLLLCAGIAVVYNQPVAFGEVTGNGTVNGIFNGKVNGATIQGDRATAGTGATAWGQSTTASGRSSTAWGGLTTASNWYATAWGFHTTASGLSSTAWGVYTTASGKYSTAWGVSTTASNWYATAWGSETEASGSNSTAFGYRSIARSDTSTAFGSESQAGILLYGSDAVEVKVVEYKDNEDKTRYRIVRVSDETTVDDNSGNGYTSWSNARQNQKLTMKGNESTAFGLKSKAYADNSLAALGGITKIAASNSAAIGNGATAEQADTVALGSGATANRAAYDAVTNNYTAYLGDENKTGAAWRATHNAIAVGASANNSNTATVTRQITGVAAGTYDTDAVNVAQLKAATTITDAHNYYAGSSTNAVTVIDAVNAVDKALGKVEDGNYITAYDATDPTKVKGTFADNLKALDEAIGTKIEKDGNFIKKSDTNSVNANIMALDEALGQKAKAIGQNAEAIGQNTDAIKQNAEAIKQNADAIGQNVEEIKDNKKAIDKNTGDISALKAQDGQVVPEGELKADEFVKGQTVYEYLNSDSLSFGDNSTKIAIGKGNKATGTQSIAVGFGNKVNGNNSGAFGDPNTVTGDESYAVGNNNTIGGNNTFVLGNNVTANVDNAVVLGDKSTAEANAVSVGSKGGERQIKHVAAGTDDTDAVNVSQLKALEQQAAGNDIMLNNRINNMDNKINKVGAGAAALAALHPLDTDDKFSMGLGYGNYRDAHAMAMGLFYRPTEKVMFSVAGSMGNGENMINAGVTFALDKGKGFGTSKAAMARKINEQENEIQALQIANANLAERLAAIEAKLGK